VTNHNVELYVWREHWMKRERIYFDVFQFPGGELQLRHVTWTEDKGHRVNRVAILTRGSDPQTVITTALVVEFVRANMHVEAEFSLIQPYLPAARSDRGATSALNAYNGLFGDLSINARFNFLVHADIHNPNALDTVSQYTDGTPRHENIDAGTILKFTDGAPDREQYDGIIAPDAGAVKRAESAGDALELPVFYASKGRDFETGSLLIFRAPKGLDPNGTYLVVDDVCDGAGTFAGLADEIKREYGSLRITLDLWATHGVFSGRWRENLEGNYRHVYTTNSLPSAERAAEEAEGFITVCDICSLLIGD
jgi:ribose-phosphate pyrophosphokinase